MKKITFLFVFLFATPVHALQESRCASEAESIAGLISDIQTYHEPITAQLAEKILQGYASTRSQNQEAFDRLALALETRFAKGCLLQVLIAEPETQVFVLYSDVGDRIIRIFAPVARWPRSDIEIEQQESQFLEILETITRERIIGDRDEFIESIWKSTNFSKVTTADNSEMYSWGIPPDFIEVTLSDHNDQNCEFMPVQGWMARQICP